MTKTIPSAKRIRLLLNTLAGERYVRRPLLAELVDELTVAQKNPEAAQAGRVLLERLEAGIDECEYQRRIGRIFELAARQSPWPQSC
jgi:hypothetical protein